MTRGLLVAMSIAGVTITALAQSGARSGFDPADLDRSVRAQDDMFRHVNGGWLARTAIPDDRAIYGTFVEIVDHTEADLRVLVEAIAADRGHAPFSPAQQAGDLFRSFMDEPAIDRAGLAPIAARLADIERVGDTRELAALLGRLSVIGVPGAVSGEVEADVGDPTRHTIYLSQSGTALPDRDYYLLDDARFVDIRAKYQAYLERIFTMAGRPDAAAAAKAVLGLETELARAQWTSVENRDAVKTYNPMPVTQIVARMPGFDWMAWAGPIGIDDAAEWVIQQPSFFTAFAAMVPTTPLETWKAWLTARAITDAAPLLHAELSEAAFDFFGRTLTGQQAQRDRWKRGISLVNASVGEGLGRLYVEKHFPPEARTRMQRMIANLIEAYRQAITESTWMTPATRKEALAKLAKFTPKVGYPDRWRDYGSLRIVPGDLVGNVDRARAFETEYQIAKLDRPVDKFDWLMTPQTVNAYYNPPKNEIVFPAAILQRPFFDMEADDAMNYGAIGSVIGHEIGHGFDDQGRHYDGDGRLRDWWTPEDQAEFQRRTQRLVEQFAAYSPLPGIFINGELTLGENIGDLAGVSIAHRAWRLSLDGRPSPTIDGLTGEQRFFMGWVQAWRAKARDEYLQRQVLADPHSWAEFRANGPLTNIDAFYEAFDVQPGDRMYRAPEERVRIW